MTDGDGVIAGDYAREPDVLAQVQVLCANAVADQVHFFCDAQQFEKAQMLAESIEWSSIALRDARKKAIRNIAKNLIQHAEETPTLDTEVRVSLLDRAATLADANGDTDHELPSCAFP